MERFQIATVYDHRALTALDRCVRKTCRRRLDLTMRILGGLFLAVDTAFMVLMRWLDIFEWDASTVLLTLCCLLILCVFFFEDHLNAWVSGGLTYGYRQEATAEMDEDEYVIAMPGTVGHWKYGAVGYVCETKGYFVFLLDKRHGQVFDKSGFREGDPDSFRMWIAEKTGRPVRSV